MSQQWYRRPGEPILQMQVPRIYGSTPTLFGAPLADTPEALRAADADVAFIGMPWRAPTPDTYMGPTAANFEGTLLTPSQFRVNSLKYGGYLPELDLDVFSHFKLVDCGDVQIMQDMGQTLTNVEERIDQIIQAGAIPISMGGNAGPSTYPVLQSIARHADGPVAVLNFDAHHDNRGGDRWEDDDPRLPQWGVAWAGRILTLPGVDPARYVHFGLRGSRNDQGTIGRFVDKGVKPENIYTYRDLKRIRRGDFDEFAEHLARQLVDGAAKVWIAVDPDVLDLSTNPSFGDEPLGPKVHEVLEMVYQVGRAAGRERLGGLAFMATPHDAQTLHSILIYILLYALAGTVAVEA